MQKAELSSVTSESSVILAVGGKRKWLRISNGVACRTELPCAEDASMYSHFKVSIWCVRNGTLLHLENMMRTLERRCRGQLRLRVSQLCLVAHLSKDRGEGSRGSEICRDCQVCCARSFLARCRKAMFEKTGGDKVVTKSGSKDAGRARAISGVLLTSWCRPRWEQPKGAWSTALERSCPQEGTCDGNLCE